MIKVQTDNDYKSVCAIYAGTTPIDYIFDDNDELVFYAGREYERTPLISLYGQTTVLNNYRIYGNDGGVGDKTVNLWDKTLTEGYSLNAAGAAIEQEGYCTNLTPLSVNKDSYMVSITSNPEKVITGFYAVFNNDILIRRVLIDSFPAIINTSEGNQLYLSFGNNLTAEDIYTIMVSEGNTVPEHYEPYGYKIPIKIKHDNGNEITIKNIYLDTPLFKSGNNADYLDFRKQKRFNRDGTSINLFLPGLTTYNWFTTISVETTVPPNNIYMRGAFTPRYYVSFFDDTGETLLDTEDTIEGNSVSYLWPFSPWKQSTPQYDYSFVGWSINKNSSTVTEGCLENIYSDTNVYAVFNGTLRYYTVYFYNGSSLLQTSSNVPYGGSATYTGNPPTKADTSTTSYLFSGWSPSSSNITGHTSCYAQYYEVTQTITDNWAEIAEHVKTGDYTTRYSIGDTKILDLGTQGKVAMQIVAFDTDELASGVGKAPITWISKQVLKSSHRMNPSRENGVEGTGSLGGWDKSEMKTYLNESIKSLMPTVVQNSIKTVNKYTRIKNISGATVNNVLTEDEIWLPSYQEVYGDSNEEASASYYSATFSNDTNRIKSKVGATASSTWWLRTSYYTNGFQQVTGDGSAGEESANNSRGVVLGFCTGAIGHTVQFYNGNTLLEEVRGVQTGETATYTGSTPTKSGTANTEYVFSGWNPSPSNVTADISCYAQYYEVTQTITDSWAEIAEHVGAGDYTTRYSVGDTKFLDLGSEGKVAMEIVGIDTDDLADNSGKAPITWISKQLLKTSYKMYPSSSGYTATWASSTMRTHLREDIFSLLPAEVQSSIKEVKKYTNNRTGATTWSTVQSNETVWIPSYKEVGGASTVETSGITYNTFTNNASREKVKIDTASKTSWWLRSASTNSSSSYQSYFCSTTQSGAASSSGYQCYYSYGVALGFCTGVQTHTVYFYNGDTLLQTIEGVSHGGTAIYTGAEPTSSEPNYVFSGWSPSNTNITSDTSCYAQFVDSRLSETITDSWSEIVEACGDGTYSTKYHIGDTKILDLGSEGQVEMQIVGINVDDLSDNSGKAPITWISKQLLKTSHDMYSSAYNYYANWASTTMRSYLRDTILPLMPTEVQNGIKEVKKYTHNRTGSASWVTTQSNETVWIPSYKEVGGTASVETDGIVYSSIANDTTRSKTKVGDSSVIPWWLRSASTYTDAENYYFCIVGNTGRPTHYGSYCYGALGIALGFCL